MTNIEKLRSTVLVLLFNIFLPTLDVGTDLRLIIKFWNMKIKYKEEEWSGFSISIALLIPFIFNYVISWIHCILGEKLKYFLFPLLNLYPQYEATLIILKIWKNPKIGLIEKRKYERAISLNESLVEAIPTTLLLTSLWTVALTAGNIFQQIYETIIGEKGSVDEWMFYLTYGVSILSAGFGLAKCLKVGAAANMGEGGPLDGLLSLKFIVLFLSTTSVLLFKAVLIVFTCHFVSCSNLTFVFVKILLQTPVASTQKVFINTIIFFSLVFLPNMLMAMISTIEMRNKNSWKILMSQAAFILLPMFTFFTFQKINLNLFCSSLTDPRVRFSPRMSQANIIMSVAGYFGWMLWIINTYDPSNPYQYPWFIFLLSQSLNVTMPMLIISIFLTEIYINFHHLERFCCSIPKEEIHIYDPDQPEKHFVLKDEHVIELDTGNHDPEYFELQNCTIMSNIKGDSKCSMTFMQK